MFMMTKKFAVLLFAVVMCAVTATAFADPVIGPEPWKPDSLEAPVKYEVKLHIQTNGKIRTDFVDEEVTTPQSVLDAIARIDAIMDENDLDYNDLRMRLELDIKIDDGDWVFNRAVDERTTFTDVNGYTTRKQLSDWYYENVPLRLPGAEYYAFGSAMGFNQDKGGAGLPDEQGVARATLGADDIFGIEEYDFANHTYYFRARFVYDYQHWYYEGTDEIGNPLIHSDYKEVTGPWSETAAVGKNAGTSPGPSDPIDPADPANPSDPIDPIDPADPADPADPENPGHSGSKSSGGCDAGFGFAGVVLMVGLVSLKKRVK
jgi:hypothetical protein